MLLWLSARSAPELGDGGVVVGQLLPDRQTPGGTTPAPRPACPVSQQDQTDPMMAGAEDVPGRVGRARAVGQRRGQGSGLLASREGPGVCRRWTGPVCRWRSGCGPGRVSRRRRRRAGGQLAADRQGLVVHGQGLGLDADLLGQVAQLEVRLRQDRPRGAVGLALEQLFQLLVEPGGRAEELVAQPFSSSPLSMSSSLTPSWNDRMASRARSKRAWTLVLASAKSALALVTRALARVSSRFFAASARWPASAPRARPPARPARRPGHGRRRDRRAVPLAQRRARREAARARPRPARRPPTARRRRPAPGRSRSGPRAASPSPSGRRLPAPGRSRGRAGRGRREVAPAGPCGGPSPSVALERGLAGEQAIERGAQAVDVRARAEAVEVAGGLLGAHVGRRAQRRAGQRLGAAAGRRGHQRPLVRRRTGSAFPSGLARPQSTTRVSPCLPTITLPGLMSRWSTPRLWA